MRPEVVEKRLASLSELSRSGKRINGLHRLLSSPSIWERAYEAIAPNKGALTPGTDPNNTLDGFSLERMERIITQVMGETFRFAPVRRQYIPKANGKKRPLGIPNADDKLVQAAAKIVLEHIYEPIFSNASHGFRPERSCHTALDHVRVVWKGVIWLIDVDVVGFFDNINHSILLNLLRKRIEDEKFLGLIKGMLAAGYLENWTWHATHSGTPQGGVISPLLANVYLHELDQFVLEQQTKYNMGEKRRPNPVHYKLSYSIQNRRRRIDELRASGRETEAQRKLEEIRELHAAREKVDSKDNFDPNYRRLRYVRYADDFLIGIIGPKQEAMTVMSDITCFLKEQPRLDVSKEKSKLVHAKDGVIFLGYTVRTRDSKYSRRVQVGGRIVTKRTPSRRLQLHLPEAKLAAFVERQKLGNYHTIRGEPRHALVNNSDAEIITVYNSVMRGLAEYYKLGTLWRTQLERVRYIWWYSLMKTLAAKHKTSIANVVYCRMKKHLGDRGLWVKGASGPIFFKVFRFAHIKDMEINHDARMEKMAPALWLGRSDLIDRLRAKMCEACGRGNVPLEIHHARRLADTQHMTLTAQVKAARQRKRIVLCRACHVALHAGNLQARLDQMKADVGAG